MLKNILLWKGKPFKNLIYGVSKKGGRNSFGRICSFKKGGGFKRKYRIIDYQRNLYNIPALIMRIEYDPIRNAKIALICYKNGFISYIIAIEGLNIGDQVINFNFLKKIEEMQVSVKSNKGSSLFLKNIPAGFLISNIELTPGFGACFCRAAGTFAIILNKYIIFNKNYILVRLPSGVEYLLLDKCRAVLGIVSNVDYRLISWKKAGVSRNKGIRPTVRGVAMNPVDHPHGGGEGRKSPKRCAMSPWGKLSKGIKTRKRQYSNNFILKKRNG